MTSYDRACIGVPPWRRRALATRHRIVWAVIGAVVALLMGPTIAHAAGAGAGTVMPWTGPLQTLLDNLSGPTARIVAGLGFVIGGWLMRKQEEIAAEDGKPKKKPLVRR